MGAAAHFLGFVEERRETHSSFLSFCTYKICPFVLFEGPLTRLLDSSCGWLKAIRSKQKERLFHNSSGSNLAFPSCHSTDMLKTAVDNINY